MKTSACCSVLLLIVLIRLAGANPLQHAWDRAWKGDYKGAVKEYQTFAQKNPDNPQAAVALYNAANLSLTSLDQKSEAEKLFAQLVQKYPDTRWAAESCRRLSLLALEGKRTEEAVRYFRQALAKVRTKDYQMPEVWVAGLAGDWREHLGELDDPATAVTMYREVLQAIPPGESAAQTQFELTGMLKKTGKDAEAAQALAEIMSCYPHTRWAAKAMQEDRELVSRFQPDFPFDDVKAINGTSGLLRAGNFVEADSIFASVSSKYPNAPLGQNAQFGRIGTAVYLSGDFEMAVNQLQDFQSKYPKAYRMRDVERRLEAWSDLARMEASLKEDPHDYATHSAVGFNQLQMRFYPQAEKHFLAALADTTSDQARLGLGYTYLAQGNSEKAMEHLETYLQKHQTEGNAYNNVGYAYLNMGEMEKALKCFERYRDLEPSNANAHDSYAECLMNMDRLDEAAAEYQKALEINPNFTNAYYMLGQVYSRKGERTTAVDYYKKYLNLSPTGTQAEQAQAAVDSLSGNGNQ